MKKITFLSLLVLIVAASLIGCNATRGVGKDIADSGEHIQNIGK